MVQVLIAYTRKCQAIAIDIKQPCLVTERATENDGCSFSVWMGRTVGGPQGLYTLGDRYSIICGGSNSRPRHLESD